MALPSIGQARLIADQLEGLVRSFCPHSIGIIGCAGGNGLDRLAGTSVTRIVGVDLNPEYIEQTRRRYQGRFPGLELYVADIQAAVSHFEPVDLLFVALVLEYVDLERTITALWRHCKNDGVLAVIAQLPHETMKEVSPSPYTTLNRLAPVMRLLSPQELQLRAGQAGFRLEHSSTILSPGGKGFSVDTFRRASEPTSRPATPAASVTDPPTRRAPSA
jgi:ubiquinone/menaquinone biosynthesis C-methylase UbiE